MTRTRTARVLRAAAALTLVLAAAGAAGAGLWIRRDVLPGLPEDLRGLRDWRPPGACRILAADGTEIHRFYDERRFWVPLDELPEHLARSVLVAEDRSFLEHPGVDLRGIARALRQNLRAGETVQGGSTITQQVVKKLLVGQDRTLTRKAKEALLAFRLEATLSKAEILELYLNYVALGAGNNGVEAAAQDYFGRSARDLDPGQSALLAGLIPAPSRTSPRHDPEAAAERRAVVLRSRVALGDLTEEDIAPLLVAPVLAPSPPPEPLAADYATAVAEQIVERFGHAPATARGLVVETPLDLELQRAVHGAVAAAAEAVLQRQGPRGPRGRAEDEERFRREAPGLRRAMGAVMSPAPGDCFLARVGDRGLDSLAAGPFTVALSPREQRQRVAATGPGRGRRSLAASVEPGDVLSLCAGDDGSVALDRRPWAEGAAVVLENATGRVLALVGGLEPTQGGYVRATHARRQPGSTFKTFVYAAALKDGLSPLDRVWPPAPPDGDEPPVPAGPTLRDALARSINEASVHLYRRRAPGAVRDLAEALGVRTPLRDDPSVALGSSEVTPLDLASAYSALARMGVPIEPALIDRLLDVDGRVLGVRGGPVVLGAGGVLPGAPGPRALDDGVARALVGMLERVVEQGTARAAYRPDRARAGKTGTTDDFVDAWFVGMTPAHTVAVWIGADDRLPLGPGEFGGRAALPAWQEIVEALGEEEGAGFGPAPGAVAVPASGGWAWVPRDRVPASALRAPELDGSPLPPFGVAARPAPPRR